MTLIFMSFLTCVIAGRHVQESFRILAPLLLLGAGSVIWWCVTGDLRPYAVVKFGPVLLILPFLWTSAERAYLWAVLGLFGLAQAAELADWQIYSFFPLSGHTIKHLLATAATYCILRWRIALKGWGS